MFRSIWLRGCIELSSIRKLQDRFQAFYDRYWILFLLVEDLQEEVFHADAHEFLLNSSHRQFRHDSIVL